MSRMAASIECHPDAGKNGAAALPAKGWRACAGLLAAVILSFACTGGGDRSPADTRPNMLLITVDSLRADHLGYAGLDTAATPNIDALAARSVRFTEAQTPSPLTLPSTAVIMTGRYPSSTGVRTEEHTPLPASETTIAEALSDAGYTTDAVVGSILLHPKFGLDQGFADYMLSFAETPRPRNTPVVGLPRGDRRQQGARVARDRAQGAVLPLGELPRPALLLLASPAL